MKINSNAFVSRKVKHVVTGKLMVIHHGHNTNNSDDIIWISIDGQKTKRATGRNIEAIYHEVDAAIASGEAVSLM